MKHINLKCTRPYQVKNSKLAIEKVFILLSYFCWRGRIWVRRYYCVLPATWLWHSAPLHNSELWLELALVKYKCFMPAARVDNSLQLLKPWTASHFKHPSQYKTYSLTPLLHKSLVGCQSGSLL